MRDPVSTDRISAYLDGELSERERERFERQLAESEEVQQLLEEFESLRADLNLLPTFTAPANLQAVVEARIEAEKVTPASKPPITASPKDQHRTRRRVFLAAVSLVAMVAAMVAIILVSGDPTVEPIEGESPPNTRQTAPDHLVKPPQMILLYDFTVHKAGAFQTLLQKMEIGLDPSMKLSGDVEDELLAIRETKQGVRTEPYKKRAAAPEKGAQDEDARDEVELIYITGTLVKLDQVWSELKTLERANEVSNVHVDVVLEDRQLEVMRKLQESAIEHFVRSTPAGPANEAYAFKLNFHLRFASFGVPGAGSFAMPALRATNNQAEGLATDASSLANLKATGTTTQPTAEMAANDNQLAEEKEPTGQLLIILRKAPAEAQ